MSQIKKKFIADKAIDGSKILLQNNEAFKALSSAGVEQSIMKFNASNVLEFSVMPEVSADPTGANQVVRKSYVDTKASSEETRAMAAEALLDGRISSLESSSSSAIAAEEARAKAAEGELDGRLDVLEGADNVAGSVAKSLKDAKAYADQKISDLVNGAPGVLDTLKELSDALGGDANFAATLAGQIAGLDGRLDTLEGDETTAGSLAKTLKDAKDYTDAEVSAEETRAMGEEQRIEGNLNQEILDRQDAVTSLESADSAMDARLDVIEGDASTVGSIAKAQSDAYNYTDAQVLTEKNRAEGEESRIEGKVDQEKTDREAAILDEATRAMGEESRIENKLDEETARATQAEQGLQAYADGLYDDFNPRILELETDRTTKTYVDDKFAAEMTRAEGEEARIEVLVSAEQVRAQAAETALDVRVGDLEFRWPDSQSDLERVIFAEQTRAQAAEASLRSDMEQGSTYLQAQVSAEETRAIGEEQRIKGKVDQEIQNRQGAVSEERVRAQGEESRIESKVDVEKARIDAILLASDADKDSFAEIVALINSVDTTNDQAFASYVLSNDAALALETQNRQSYDSALSQTISNEIVRAQNNESRIEELVNQEVSARQAAVSAEQSRAMAAESALDARLDILEQDPTTKAYVDGKVSMLEASIETEQTTREAEVVAIEGRLDILEAVAHYKESFTMGAMVPAYVELSQEAMENSTVVFVGRLGAIEGVDYSVSVVGGKTRITWTGELASGGASALTEGDKVHVKYMK